MLLVGRAASAGTRGVCGRGEPITDRRPRGNRTRTVNSIRASGCDLVPAPADGRWRLDPGHRREGPSRELRPHAAPVGSLLRHRTPRAQRRERGRSRDRDVAQRLQWSRATEPASHRRPTPSSRLDPLLTVSHFGSARPCSRKRFHCFSSSRLVEPVPRTCPIDLVLLGRTWLSPRDGEAAVEVAHEHAVVGSRTDVPRSDATSGGRG